MTKMAFIRTSVMAALQTATNQLTSPEYRFQSSMTGTAALIHTTSKYSRWLRDKVIAYISPKKAACV